MPGGEWNREHLVAFRVSLLDSLPLDPIGYRMNSARFSNSLSIFMRLRISSLIFSFVNVCTVHKHKKTLESIFLITSFEKDQLVEAVKADGTSNGRTVQLI